MRRLRHSRLLAPYTGLVARDTGFVSRHYLRWVKWQLEDKGCPFPDAFAATGQRSTHSVLCRFNEVSNCHVTVKGAEDYGRHYHGNETGDRKIA